MSEDTIHQAVTHDTLFNGELSCSQPVQGYRFSLDAVLAAQFVHPKPAQRVLDLGCGCGIIGLILAYREPTLLIHALELQPELANIAEHNSRVNGFADTFQVLRGDVTKIRSILPAESQDLVTCNPPYGRTRGGRVNEHAQAATARHEMNSSLDDFVRAAAYAVCNRGKVVFVYPARRGATLLHTMLQHRLTPKRVLPVYSYPEAKTARLMLVEAVKNGGEQFELLAPLYIYTHQNGEQTEAMNMYYEANAQCLPK